MLVDFLYVGFSVWFLLSLSLWEGEFFELCCIVVFVLLLYMYLVLLWEVYCGLVRWSVFVLIYEGRFYLGLGYE